MTQVYKNSYETPIDVTFRCPLLQNVIYDGFEAKFGDTVIKGLVKEKQAAQKEYEEKVQAGYQAVIAQTNSATTDILDIAIGNIQAGQEVTLTLTYLAPLEKVV